MHSRIPLPTDNIYKFYALFGLVIVLFFLSSIIYVNKVTNDLIFQVILEEEKLNSLAELTSVQEARKVVLTRKYEIALSDKNFFQIVAAVFLAGGGYLMYYGFYHWHNKIQPVQDELAQLSIKKLKKELRPSLSNRRIK